MCRRGQWSANGMNGFAESSLEGVTIVLCGDPWMYAGSYERWKKGDGTTDVGVESAGLPELSFNPFPARGATRWCLSTSLLFSPGSPSCKFFEVCRTSNQVWVPFLYPMFRRNYVSYHRTVYPQCPCSVRVRRISNGRRDGKNQGQGDRQSNR